IHRTPQPSLQFSADDEEHWHEREVALREAPEESWGSPRGFGGALALWVVDRDWNDVVCAATLRLNWRDSWLTTAASGVLLSALPAQPGDMMAPAAVPLPSTPPRRTSTVSGTRGSERWPTRVAFVLACFTAGLLFVGHMVSSEAPAPRREAPAK